MISERHWLTAFACALSLGISSFLFGINTQIPYLTEVIYTSSTAIDQKYATFQKELEKKLDQFILYSKNQQYDDAYRTWSDLCNSFFALKLELRWTHSLAPEQSVKEYAATKSAVLFAYMTAELKNWKNLPEAFVANGMAAHSLTPLQRYITRGVLSDYLKMRDLDKEKIRLALKTIAKHKEADFSCIEGTSPSTLAIDVLKAFTANIICFPEELSYLHGGISHWKNRLGKLANLSKETGAQILCFQEVWDPNAMIALAEHLKDQYPFQVFDPGNQFATLNAEEIGWCSGLFIASKIPFDAVEFTPFSQTELARGGAKRGALLTTFTIKGQKISCLNTHMQHGYDAAAGLIRKEQILACHQLLQEAIEEAKDISWGFLAGDTNINAFTPEFKESGIQNLFSIPYLKDQTEITTTNSTATNYFLNLFLAPKDKRSAVLPDTELLDYCICPATLNRQYENQKIPLYSLSDPENALSDHHGILTTWKLTP